MDKIDIAFKKHEGLKELYFEDPIFRACLDAINQDKDEYLVIAELCSMIRHKNNEIQALMMKSPSSFVYKPKTEK